MIDEPEKRESLEVLTAESLHPKARNSEGAETAMRTHHNRQREALRAIASQQKAKLIS